MTDFEQTTLDGATNKGETTLRGVVKSVIHHSPRTDFSVIRMLTLDGRDAVVVGELGTLAEGEPIRVTGTWEQHRKHGSQLRAQVVVPELPTTATGIEQLLASRNVRGIGADLAKRLLQRFGSATIDVIVDHPERLKEVAGVGKKRAKTLHTIFKERRADMEARAFLHAAGIGTGLAQRVVKKFGDKTVATVREDPYRLARDVDGIGFRTADVIGRQLGIAANDPRRAAGAILHLILEAGDQGHSALPEQVLRVQAQTLGIEEGPFREGMASLASAKHIVVESELVYAPPLHRAEVRLARGLLARSQEAVESIDASVFESASVAQALGALSEKQRHAVRQLPGASLLVITGGPGTGKTTTVRAIVAVAEGAQLGLSLAAPTGRAARRLAEATGRPASTLHRLLEWNPRLARFARDAANPLEADIVLVDETSMVDVVLASRLLDALAPGARLVLVGDADQLPSVGPGTVLADLLATAWIPSVRLTEVFRQANESAIVRAAHAILRGEMPPVSPARSKSTSGPPAGELYFVRAEDPVRAAELLVSMVTENIPRAFGLDALRDVQVLVPMHKGPLGAQSLNRELQRVLNAGAAQTRARDTDERPQPRAGDKVMQTRNDYEREVWNGDIGRVVSATADAMLVQMEGREVRYEGDAAEALVLAYAATVHKAQGSEYEAVVIGLAMGHYMLLQRALVYTAVTRARKLAVIVGSEKALERAIANTETAERYGALARRLAQR